MKKTTFYTIEICGPAIPAHTVADKPEQWRLMERTRTTQHHAKPGAWSKPALQRMAARAGVQLLAAYWMDYCPRDGYKNKKIIL